jgi:hypothetical protein
VGREFNTKAAVIHGDSAEIADGLKRYFVLVVVRGGGGGACSPPPPPPHSPAPAFPPTRSGGSLEARAVGTGRGKGERLGVPLP